MSPEQIAHIVETIRAYGVQLAEARIDRSPKSPTARLRFPNRRKRSHLTFALAYEPRFYQL